MKARAAKHNSGKPRQPKIRSPIPPPGYIIDETSYDREEQKKALEQEVDAYFTGRDSMKKIRISAGSVSMLAQLNSSDTARRLLQHLPISSEASTWGNEVYCVVPMSAEYENEQAEVPHGAVAFWPDGNCLCVFFGQRPVGPVNVVGHVLGDAGEFGKVSPGDPMQIELAE
jgi:hypothetical protein